MIGDLGSCSPTTYGGHHIAYPWNSSDLTLGSKREVRVGGYEWGRWVRLWEVPVTLLPRLWLPSRVFPLLLLHCVVCDFSAGSWLREERVCSLLPLCSCGLDLVLAAFAWKRMCPGPLIWEASPMPCLALILNWFCKWSVRCLQVLSFSCTPWE